MRPASTAAAATLGAVLLLAGCSGDTADVGDLEQPTDAGPAPTSSTPSSAPTDSVAAVPRPRLAGTVARGLEVPWGLAFLPDGSALVSERDSERIRLVSSDGDVGDVGRVQGVDGVGEGGLLGIAVSPTFAEDRLVFAYLTAGDENRVVRMTYDGQQLSGQRRILGGIPAGPIHNGGRIGFGPDGMLYVGTGEAGRTELSQDKRSLGGKILRISPDGGPAPDNPFEGSPVYSLGHRNVQGLAWDSRGQLWAAEFGQNEWDELNRVEAGGNYGWPEVEGRSGSDRFVDPVRQWRTSVASPSGIAVAGDSVFMAGLRGERLWQIPIPGGRAGKPRALLNERYGRLRTVALAPDGSLWVTTSNRDGRGSVRDGDDRILRLTLAGSP
ncbi:MAG: PQQ-dependent sugar dehydrogenase [Sporichthyaceae bacterium]|nr:PQQ-dependent sugar dehydrogenase [Sporichthyaceae bacterium]